MASEQRGLKIGQGEAGNKVRVRFFCWKHCLRQLNIGNTSSYPYTHSNAQESHFCCPCSKEAWRFAGSNNTKRLVLRGLKCHLNCSLKSKRNCQIFVGLSSCKNYSRFFGGDIIITAKDLAMCHQDVPERRKYQPVNFFCWLL